MIVKSIESSWIPFQDSVVFEATEQECVTFGTFFGDKEFWIEAGERVRLRVPKSLCLEVGDHRTIGQVITPSNQLRFHWNWVY